MKWGAGSKWGKGTKWGAAGNPATVAAYEATALDMLPRGPVWTGLAARKLSLALRAVADVFAYAERRIRALRAEYDPRTTTELLDDWEEAYGLPLACDPSPPTSLADRRAALHAAVVATGGSSIPYYVEVAAALGVVITITEHPFGVPFRAGTARAGDPLGSAALQFVWEVSAPGGTPTALRDRLECRFGLIKPSHTIVTFAYP